MFKSISEVFDDVHDVSVCAPKRHTLYPFWDHRYKLFLKYATRVLIMFGDNTMVIFKNLRYNRTIFASLIIHYLCPKKVMLL